VTTFITVLYVFCCVVAIVLVLAVATFVTWYCVVDRPDSRAGHASGLHLWFRPELLAPARHALCAAMNSSRPAEREWALNSGREGKTPDREVKDEGRAFGGLNNAQYVPGPVAITPPMAVPAGPGTPVQRYAAIAWEHAGNRRAGNWPMGDPGDFTPSAWTKRSAAELATRLAREETDAGFASINPAGIVAYACSSVLPRWKEVA
jgi:hypothetical protein